MLSHIVEIIFVFLQFSVFWTATEGSASVRALYIVAGTQGLS
jgi:hypothetical protein